MNPPSSAAPREYPTTGEFIMRLVDPNALLPYKTPRAWRFQVAAAMARHVEQERPGEMGALEQYMCYWVGLQNICVTIANEEACRPAFLTSEGQLELEQVGGFSMPKVRMPEEREELDAAYKAFPPQLKEKLILHRCTRFFVNRLPRFHGDELTVDARGQELNGVMDIGRTVEATNPVWCPIDQALYYSYLGGERTSEGTDKLGKEILTLLYTIGKNRLHGEKRADDASTRDVVEHGLPLLKEVVNWFVNPSEPGVSSAS
jgi:hypothetical protein